MLPVSQPQRPKVHTPNNSNPLFQQQIRNSHPQADGTSVTSGPQSQIEAMPPSRTTAVPLADQRSPSPLYNPALMHPVFFGNGWRKAPFPMPFNNGFSPVATGYVFGDGRVRAGSTTKL